MKQLVLILIVLVGFFLSDCKKEKQLPFYINATFQTENTVSVNSVRVFTRNGEITDTQFIRNFIYRNTTAIGFSNYYLFNTQTQTLNPVSSLKISFGDNNTASLERYPIYAPSPLETHSAVVTTISTDELLITETDSISRTFFPNLYCEDLGRSLVTFKPNRNCVLISGNSENCKWKHNFPIEINGKQLKLPMILWLTVHGFTVASGFGCLSLIQFDAWNTFDNSIINSLQATDTIAIQTKEVILKKL